EQLDGDAGVTGPAQLLRGAGEQVGGRGREPAGGADPPVGPVDRLGEPGAARPAVGRWRAHPTLHRATPTARVMPCPGEWPGRNVPPATRGAPSTTTTSRRPWTAEQPAPPPRGSR